MVIFATDHGKPIYLQLAEWLEKEILSGNIAADERIYSQYQLAEMFNINPATAARGLNILVDEEILYKKRGLGMFLSPGAVAMIKKRRRKQNLERLVRELVEEARLLNISRAELGELIRGAHRGEKGEKQ